MTENLSAEAVLAQKGMLAKTVVGTSMNPLLKQYRDTVVVEPVNGSLRKYDVVLFRRDEQLVLHRIVRVKDGYFLIRGDNCINSEKVCDKQIIGKMTHFCRNGKQYDVKSKSYRVYSFLWVRSFAVRRFFVKLTMLFKSMVRRLNGTIKK